MGKWSINRPKMSISICNFINELKIEFDPSIFSLATTCNSNSNTNTKNHRLNWFYIDSEVSHFHHLFHSRFFPGFFYFNFILCWFTYKCKQRITIRPTFSSFQSHLCHSFRVDSSIGAIELALNPKNEFEIQ